jgi:hypothetical protein
MREVRCGRTHGDLALWVEGVALGGAAWRLARAALCWACALAVPCRECEGVGGGGKGGGMAVDVVFLVRVRV